MAGTTQTAIGKLVRFGIGAGAYVMMATVDIWANRWKPVWPVIIAPFSFLVYYLALRTAFAQSIEAVLGKPGDGTTLPGVVWGAHWAYRGIAEYLSVTLAASVSGGVARGRAKAAAVIGSLAVSLLFAGEFGFYLYNWKYLGGYVPSLEEPWYQIAMDGAMIVAAPIIALLAAGHLETTYSQEPGLFGLNRWHVTWLWLIAYFYGLAMIAPIARFYDVQMTGNIIATALVLIVNFVPTAVVALPLYYGLTILRGDHGGTMPPAARNFVGALVLIGGLIVGMVVQYGWYWMFEKLRDAIFGS